MVSISLAQDSALKSAVCRAPDQKPHFAWSEAVADLAAPRSDVRVISSRGEEAFEPAKVAQSVGDAITDLEISRGNNTDIFNDDNRSLVAHITKEVTENLRIIVSDSQPPRARASDLHVLIEKTLA